MGLVAIGTFDGKMLKRMICENGKMLSEMPEEPKDIEPGLSEFLQETVRDCSLAIKNRTKICPEEKRRPRNHGN
jgi:hypothetical protein